MDMEEKRKCFLCGEYLKGRSDKKFCNDHCRNTYNNLLKTNDEENIRSINQVLRKNRQILKESIFQDSSIVDIILLKGRGFVVEFHTHIRLLDTKTYFYCYDIGYTFVNAEAVKIVISHPKN